VSRRSTLKRRRERKRRKYELRKQALQLQLPSRPSTARLLELVARQTSILADVIRELEKQ